MVAADRMVMRDGAAAGDHGVEPGRLDGVPLRDQLAMPAAGAPTLPSGTVNQGEILDADMKVSAQCNRVNVTDGHMASIRMSFANKTSIDAIREALSSFRAVPQQLRLHSAPAQAVIVRDEIDRPQPRLDRDAGNGMSVTVGRICEDNVLDYRFVALGHNTIRGAAGAAILNAELLVAKGYL